MAQRFILSSRRSVIFYSLQQLREESQWRDLARDLEADMMTNDEKGQLKSHLRALFVLFLRSFGTHPGHTSESGRLIYLSIPPKFFASVAKNINDIMRPLRKTAWLRVVFEKPFGRDIESAKKLAKELAAELKVILLEQLA